MKIAFYTEDGLDQIVLTPETSHEKAMLGKLHSGGLDLSIHRGEFYACRGGWVRHGEGEQSTILGLRPARASRDTPSSPEGTEASQAKPPHTPVED